MSVFEEIQVERDHQDDVWGGDEHDDKHSARDWVSYMIVYLGRSMGSETGWGRNRSAVRRCFIKVAALCVAACEAIDRAIAGDLEGAEPNDLQYKYPGIIRE